MFGSLLKISFEIIYFKYIAENIGNYHQNKLDVTTQLFWVPSHEIDQAYNLFNNNDDTIPIIYHVMGGRGHYENKYIDIYNKIMSN